MIRKVKQTQDRGVEEELLNSFAKLASKSYSEEIQNKGILSLSEVPDNILMWSHYSDQHRGICIELERKKDNDLSDNNITLPVRYSLKKPIITIDEHSSASGDDEKEIRRSLIYTKSIDWNYEREWRAVKDEGNKAYKLNSKIKTIIFGTKTPEHSIKTIFELLTKIKKEVRFRKARLKDDDFGIEIADFDPNLMKFSDIATSNSASQAA
ncbi:DUF2971 domain-containing protein, partial [Comamonas aquatica]|uniref:DUF2971 domain-containing protein n=1 Tax=Comamonas aquatica TaxID=225991 RepID=UPI003D01EEA9